MIAVSNTTPLRYLVAIGQDDLLRRLFDRVYIPTGVHEELTDPKTPEVVRRQILSLPTWLEIRAVREAHAAEFPVTLHRGEREAILLAEPPIRRSSWSEATQWVGPNGLGIPNTSIFIWSN